MSDFNEFVTLVRRMRELQTEYFRTKDRAILPKAKAAERAVDKLLSEHGDRHGQWDSMPWWEKCNSLLGKDDIVGAFHEMKMAVHLHMRKTDPEYASDDDAQQTLKNM